MIRVDGKNYRERPVIIPENARVWLTRYAKSEGRVRHSNHVKYWDDEAVDTRSFSSYGFGLLLWL